MNEIFTSEILITVLFSSLLGSLHCVGMCGGLVALCCFSGDTTQSKAVSYISEFAYHCMRFASYISLGFVAGLLGDISSQYISAAGFQRGFGVVAGTLLVFWGLRDLGLLSFLSRLFSSYPALQNISSLQYSLSSKLLSLPFFKYPLQSKGITRGVCIGLMSGLLPCGWLYAYVLTASTTESPLYGAMVMAAFWLGTVPVLFLFARVLKKMNSLLLKRIPRISAVCIIVLGLMSISGRMSRIEDPSMFKKDKNKAGMSEHDRSSSCH